MSWLVLLPLVLLTLFALATTRLVRRIEHAVDGVERAMASLPDLAEQSRRLRAETEAARRAFDQRPNP